MEVNTMSHCVEWIRFECVKNQLFIHFHDLGGQVALSRGFVVMGNSGSLESSGDLIVGINR